MSASPFNSVLKKQLKWQQAYLVSLRNGLLFSKWFQQHVIHKLLSLRKAWMQVTRQKDVIPIKHSRMWSWYFWAESYKRNPDYVERFGYLAGSGQLKPKAIPILVIMDKTHYRVQENIANEWPEWHTNASSQSKIQLACLKLRNIVWNARMK